MRTQKEATMLGGVKLGTKFVYRTLDIFGRDYAEVDWPFEGQLLTVVGFKPRNVNQVVVQAPCGCQSLIRLRDVEKALIAADQREKRLSEPITTSSPACAGLKGEQNDEKAMPNMLPERLLPE
jgi:hypothetical protein